MVPLLLGQCNFGARIKFAILGIAAQPVTKRHHAVDFRTSKRRSVRSLVRGIGNLEHYVNHGLSRQAGNGRRSGMFNPQGPATQRRTSSRSLTLKKLGPLRIVVYDQDCSR
jgi:hypothetical protein